MSKINILEDCYCGGHFNIEFETAYRISASEMIAEWRRNHQHEFAPVPPPVAPVPWPTLPQIYCGIPA